MTNKQKLKRNALWALVLQIVTIVCGFILPKLILKIYGSEVNGLVNSIIQFLAIISFLEFGIGAVIQSSLYKPLSENNYDEQSKIYVSAQRFFSRLAIILLVYIIILIFVYPCFINNNFSFMYTAILILAIGFSSFAQYYFGIVNILLLYASQNGRIQYKLQTITLIINTVLCIIFMKLGFSIQIVKLSTAVVYLSRPIFLNYYVKHNYKINKKIKYSGEPIKQKWDGVSQHLFVVVLDGTDNIILSIFSGLKNVSIYSIYYLVISGVRQMFDAVTVSIQAFLGNLYAEERKKELLESFNFIEWLMHNAIVFIMGCVFILITPFVLMYTSGVTDANYNQPLFGYLLTMACEAFCFRLPYHLMVKASGKYKETRFIYIISAIINIVFSILLVKKFGLVGVAIGTLLAMTYQTIALGIYNSKKIVIREGYHFFKQLAVDAIIMIIGIFTCKFIDVSNIDVLKFIIVGIKISLIWIIIIILINTLFYFEKIKLVIDRVKAKVGM